MAAKNVADGIAEYLQSLTAKAPVARSMIDREAVQALKDQIRSASDPIARLNLARELREASKPKRLPEAPTPGLEVFIANAKAWAEENGYTADDLRRYAKVPVDVLRQAGFQVAEVTRSTAARAGGGGGTRQPRMDPVSQVLPIAKKLGQFKLTELAEQVGRDVATTRNYVNRLVADGLLRITGEDASGPGRPAKVYDAG